MPEPVPDQQPKQPPEQAAAQPANGGGNGNGVGDGDGKTGDGDGKTADDSGELDDDDEVTDNHQERSDPEEDAEVERTFRHEEADPLSLPAFTSAVPGASAAAARHQPPSLSLSAQCSVLRSFRGLVRHQ